MVRTSSLCGLDRRRCVSYDRRCRGTQWCGRIISMVEQSLIDQKINASRQLVEKLRQIRASLLAAYWEWSSDAGRWIFYLVPTNEANEKNLVDQASGVLVDPPYRSIFSLSDVVVDKRQIERARAIGRYVRVPRDIGKRFDTTFTGGHYFEGVVVIYISPELAKQHSAA